MYSILRELWRNICEPVVKHLLDTGIPEQSHIWWCPTGRLGLLPLYAAGPYGSEQRNQSDIFVSSYAPTLSSILSGRRPMTRRLEPITQLLAIGQSKALPQVSYYPSFYESGRSYDDIR